MTTSGKFALRLALYGGVLLYAAGDILWFEGPLHRRLEKNNPDSPEAIARAKAMGTVARVFSHPIFRSQVDRAVHERLWLEGRKLADVPPQNLKLLRYAALSELIDHQLLRMKVKVNTFDLPVTPQETEARFQEFAKRFTTPQEMLAAMKAEGIPDEQALRDRLAARIQQEKYVEMRVAPLTVVSDEEVAAWFAENQDHLAIPERVEARHIFLRAAGRPTEDAQKILTDALATLKEKPGEFPALAKQLSEDPSTRENGGSLGLLTRQRLPADLAAQVFDLALNEPRLIRSTLGWHIVEITARHPAAPRTLEETTPEIRAALQAVKRRDATREFRTKLREHEQKRIEIFHDMMDA